MSKLLAVAVLFLVLQPILSMPSIFKAGSAALDWITRSPLASVQPGPKLLTQLASTWAAPPGEGLSAAQLKEVAAQYAAVLQSLPARHPIIFVPPFTGVQLELQLWNKAERPHWYCPRFTGGWRQVWLNIFALLPGAFDCFCDYMRMDYNPQTGRSVFPEGVDVRVRAGFDSAMSLMPHNQTVVFGGLAAVLQRMGWTVGVDMDAHLYDWRLSPLDWSSPGGSWSGLQQLTETLVARTGGRPAIFISLSMGSAYFAKFLNDHVSLDWKQQHVQGFISLSGLFGGTPAAVLGVVSGLWQADPRFAISSDSFKTLCRGLPALAWMMPSPDLFGPDTVLALNLATNQTFTMTDLQLLLRAAGANQAADIRRHTSLLASAPQVAVYCLYGTQVPTVGSFVFDSATWERPPSHVDMVDGDGTVALPSIQMCEGWSSQQAAPVKARQFPHTNHAEILRNVDAFKTVMDAIVELNTQHATA